MMQRHKFRGGFRRGFQLVELVVSMAIASVLISGLASAIVITSKAASVAQQTHSTTWRTDAAIDRLRSHISQATSITAKSASSVELVTVDAAQNRALVRYQWPGTGSPLEFSINGASPRQLTEPLDKFELLWNETHAQAVLPEFNSNDTFVYQARESSNISASKSGTVGVPKTMRSGDLLLIVVALANSHDHHIKIKGGDNKWDEAVSAGSSDEDDIALAVFYRTSVPDRSDIEVEWHHRDEAFLLAAHFRSPSGSARLVSSDTSTGTNSLALCPPANLSGSNALVLRAVAGNAKSGGDATTNMPGFTAIAMLRGSEDPLIGLCYTHSETDVSEGSFVMGQSGEFVTCTMVFQP